MNSTSNEANLLIELFKVFLPRGDRSVSFNPISPEDFWTEFERLFKKARGLRVGDDLVEEGRGRGRSPQPGFIHRAIVPFFSDLAFPIILRDIEIEDDKLLGSVYFKTAPPDCWGPKHKSVNTLLRGEHLDVPEQNLEEIIIRVKKRPVILVAKHREAWVSFPLSTFRGKVTIDLLSSRGFPLKFHVREDESFSIVHLGPTLAYPEERIGRVHKDFLEFLRTLSTYRFT